MADSLHMTLIEHIAELRTRLIRAVVAVIICSFISFGLFYDVAKGIIRAPLDALDPNTTNIFARYNPVVGKLRPYLTRAGGPQVVNLHAMTVTEVFLIKFKLAFLCGLILSAPFVCYQAWAFIGAGLTAVERRKVWRYVPFSLALFFAGMMFAYFVAVPIALLFLLSVDTQIIPTLMYGPYFSLIVITVALFGAAFQMPLVAMALARLGIVSARTLADKRRYAIVLMFVIGALLTPPEPFSQCLLALPLIALYELGILLAKAAEH